MSTLREYNNGGANNGWSLYGSQQEAQTFTTSASYFITSVKLLLYRVGNPGEITFSIRETSSNVPTGSDLTSGTYDGNSLTTNISGAWIEITLPAYLLFSGVKYAIVGDCPNGNSSNYIKWNLDETQSTYSGGSTAYTYGASWTSYLNDYQFEVYSTEYTPTVTTQAVSSILSTTATGKGNVTSDGGATVTERGVCWSTSPTPTTAGSKATSSGTTGSFTASITGLSPSTLYYVRAYAINSVGTSYGNQVTFTTAAQAIGFGEYIGAGSGTTKLLLHLNGNSTDSSGNGNNGTDTNITYSLANGKFGQGAGFNGGSSYIRVPNNWSSTTMSVFCWIKPEGKSGEIITDRDYTVSYWEVRLGYSSPNYTLSVVSRNSSYKEATVSSSNLLLGTNYNLIGFTVINNIITFYHNGENVGGGTLTYGFNLNNSTSYSYIGAYKDPGMVNFFDGCMDEVIVENRAWSPEEIKKYYTNSLGRF